MADIPQGIKEDASNNYFETDRLKLVKYLNFMVLKKFGELTGLICIILAAAQIWPFIKSILFFS